MELQDQPHLSDYNTTVPTSHDHGSTISTAALKVQKVYKSYRTRRKLADSAVVVEELWWQALDFARLNRSTISFFDYVKNETAASRWSRIRLNASKVGKGLSKDAMAQKLAFQHWIEAIDPRHRYGHNLNLYYEEWCRGNAGQPFFYCLQNQFVLSCGNPDVASTNGSKNVSRDIPGLMQIKERSWRGVEASLLVTVRGLQLTKSIQKENSKVSSAKTPELDIGDGKDFDLKECPRSRLRRECIRYLGPLEREHYEYIIVEGTIVHKLSGDLLDTNQGLKDSKWIFVMSTSKQLYAGQKKKGSFHHSSFLAGGATLAAGRLMAEGGKLRSVSAYSGHYRPTDGNLSSFLVFLKEHGVNLDEVQVLSPTEDPGSDETSKTVEETSKTGLSADDEQPILRAPSDEKSKASEPSKFAQIVRSSYKRSLSGNLQSPRMRVPKKEILQRMKSKKEDSYQLGDQLSLKWSTGAGPRIGCVADYPLKLRVQAFEMVELTPKDPPRHLASQLVDSLTSLGSSCKLM